MRLEPLERRMRLIIALVCTGFAGGLATAQTHSHSHAHKPRKAEAHQHGMGRLDIAIEGTTVSMALEVPADDIVGFEHVAKTSADKAKVEAAKAKLANPLTLFEVSNAAGCTVQKAEAKFDAEVKDKTEAKEKKDAQDGHAEVKAEYTLACINTAELKAIEFHYFKAFKGAEALKVNVIGPTAQSAFEVTRKKPRLELPAPKS
jgi:Protein of unknown function (DUF2796)